MHSFLFVNVIPPKLEWKIVGYPLDCGNGVELADVIKKLKCGGVALQHDSSMSIPA